MKTKIGRVALTLTAFVAAVGCSVEVGDDSGEGSVTEPVSLVDCDRDSDCASDEVCLHVTDARGDDLGSSCSTGDRCASDRDCPEDSVCRGRDAPHCMAVEHDGRDRASDRGDRAGDRASDRGDRGDRARDQASDGAGDSASDRASDGAQ